MKKIISLLFCLPSLLGAEVISEAPTIPKSESPRFIDGLVDVMSGNLIIAESHLTIQSPCEYSYAPTIISGSQEYGYDFPRLSNLVCPTYQKMEGWKNQLNFRLGESSACIFKPAYSKTLASASFGDNLGSGLLSARTNTSLYKLDQPDISKSHSFNLFTPSGSTKKFVETTKYSNQGLNFRIDEETLPSGHHLKYTYLKNLPIELTAFCSDRSTMLWKLSFDFKINNHCNSTISDQKGNWVRYCHPIKNSHITKIEFSNRPSISFNEGKKPGGEKKLIESITLPNKNGTFIEYDEKRRVKSLKLGTVNGSKLDLYKFQYDHMLWNDELVYQTNLNTSVIDCIGNESQYYYYCGEVKNHLFRTKVFEGLANKKQEFLRTEYCWCNNESSGQSNYGNRVYAEIKLTPKGVKGRKFSYDYKGNVLAEFQFGNICSEKKNVKNPLDNSDLKNKLPLNSKKWSSIYNPCDKYVKHFTYTDDGFHMPTSIIDDFGLHFEFKYLPNTNVLKEKITWKGDRKEVVENFSYDQLGNLICLEKITPITHTKTVITPVVGFYEHGAGMPQIKKEFMIFPDGREVLLLERRFTYGQGDRVLNEMVLDGAGKCMSFKENRFDNKQRLISILDEEGNEVRYEYDDNFNCVREIYVGKGLEIQNDYDLGNRIKLQKKMIGSDKVFSTEFLYSSLGNLIKKSDTLEGVIYFQYTPLGAVKKETRESILLPDGSKIDNIKTMDVDGFGYVHSIADSKNRKKSVVPNMNGDPLKIVHQDKSYEELRYRLDGKVIYHRNCAGEETKYSYDELGNVVLLEFNDPVLNIAYSESWEFADKLPVKYKDKSGNIITLEYDPAGRLIRQIILGSHGTKKFEYDYDSMGRQNKICEWIDDQQFLTYEKVFDVKDREIEVKEFDEDGKLSRWEEKQYDWLGNMTRKIVHLDEYEEAISEWVYDPIGREVLSIDPYGYKTETIYQEQVVDSKGRKTCKVVKIDPQGTRSEKFMSATGKVLEERKMSSDGSLLSHEIYFYDERDLLIYEERDVYQNGNFLRKYIVQKEYNDAGKLVKEIEEPGKVLTKVTLYEYDKKGTLCKITRPDKSFVDLITNTKGIVAERTSSDGTINEKWQYNERGNAIYVVDNELLTKREYDSFGYLRKEFLANGLCLEYSYDLLGRMTQITLPDQSVAKFQYKGSSFYCAIRYKSSGHVYHYFQDDFNLRGQPGYAEIIEIPGVLQCEYDCGGRPTALKYRGYLQENIMYDPLGNLESYDLTTTSNSHTNRFLHNALSQLIEEENHTHFLYSYDSLENRLSKNLQDYTISSLNQTLADGDSELLYDANGCLSSKTDDKGSVRYYYDALFRLKSVKLRSKLGKETEIHYCYDPFHRRIARSASSIKNIEDMDELFIYENLREIGTYDSKGLSIDFRLLAPANSEIGATISVENCTDTYRAIHSIEGNIVLLQGQTSQFAQLYSAFGETEGSDNFPSSWQFNGKRRDLETDFIYFGIRYYDPKIGRWITPDPAGFADGPNLYAFVHNKPLSQFDHFGLYGKTRFGASFQIGNTSFGFGCCKDRAENFYKNLESNNLLKYGPCYTAIVDKDGNVQRIDNLHKIVQEDHKYIININGIWVTPAGAEENGAYTSNCANGKSVIILYNPNHRHKLPECRYQKKGGQNAVSIKLADICTELVDIDPLAEICLVAHSQGGLVSARSSDLMSRKLLSRVTFIGVAPADFICDHRCKGSDLIRSGWDLIPRFSWSKLRRHASIDHCVSGGNFYDPIGEHSFQNPILKEEIEHALMDFLKN